MGAELRGFGWFIVRLGAVALTALLTIPAVTDRADANREARARRAWVEACETFQRRGMDAPTEPFDAEEAIAAVRSCRARIASGILSGDLRP